MSRSSWTEDKIKEVVLSAKIQTDGYLNTATPNPPKTSTRTVRNSRLDAIAERTVGGRLKNSLALYYDRKDLAAAMSALEDGYHLDVTGLTTTHDLIPLILAKYDVVLTEQDIVLENLVEGSIVLNISPDSYGWYGLYNISNAEVIYPPLMRTRNNLLLTTRSGLFIRRRLDT